MDKKFDVERMFLRSDAVLMFSGLMLFSGILFILVGGSNNLGYIVVGGVVFMVLSAFTMIVGIRLFDKAQLADLNSYVEVDNLLAETS